MFHLQYFNFIDSFVAVVPSFIFYIYKLTIFRTIV